MGCNRGKEVEGLLERLFGSDAALICVNASEDAVQDFTEGKGAFNKTFLRYVHKTYGPAVVSQYFRDYSRGAVEDPFIYLGRVLGEVSNDSAGENEALRLEHSYAF